jgi:hypothetical protein
MTGSEVSYLRIHCAVPATARADCASSKEQFLQPHQNVNLADERLVRVIGEGASGKVFKAVWKNC